MHESKMVPRGTVGHGQVLAASGILVALALTAPLIGLVMIPVIAVSGVARAFGHGPTRPAF
jgi:uncharacterized protein involved in cysteine biosynthesis